jgi:hypothetical protein
MILHGGALHQLQRRIQGPINNGGGWECVVVGVAALNRLKNHRIERQVSMISYFRGLSRIWLR